MHGSRRGHGREGNLGADDSLLTLDAIPLGGIEGTVSCPNVNDPSLPIDLDGTFWAEPESAVGAG